MTRASEGAHALGRWGEACAARHLEAQGWVILARNYRFGRREVDLVARRGEVLAFVEVKTRAGDGYGAPQEAITALKRREIEAVAARFIDRNGLHGLTVRFDAVAIVVRRSGGGRALALEHLEDAWRPGCP